MGARRKNIRERGIRGRGRIIKEGDEEEFEEVGMDSVEAEGEDEYKTKEHLTIQTIETNQGEEQKIRTKETNKRYEPKGKGNGTLRGASLTCLRMKFARWGRTWFGRIINFFFIINKSID